MNQHGHTFKYIYVLIPFQSVILSLIQRV